MHDQIITTDKVKSLLFKYTQEELSKKIGITRQTISKRLKDNLWKLSEIVTIKQIQ